MKSYCILHSLVDIYPVVQYPCLHFQLTCGAELALLFVETLVKGKYPYDEDTLGEFQSCDVNVITCFLSSYT